MVAKKSDSNHAGVFTWKLKRHYWSMILCQTELFLKIVFSAFYKYISTENDFWWGFFLLAEFRKTYWLEFSDKFNFSYIKDSYFFTPAESCLYKCLYCIHNSSSKLTSPSIFVLWRCVLFRFDEILRFYCCFLNFADAFIVKKNGRKKV